jgi:parallel beta-helix repeat protein
MTEHHQQAFRGIIVAILLTSLACQAVGFGLEKPDLEATIQGGMEATRAAEVDSEVEEFPTYESGEIISAGEVEIFVPPEFQDQQPAISAVVVTEVLAPAPEESTTVGQAFEITSEGELSGPVLISIQYDPAELTANEENLYIATLVDGKWQVVPDGFVDTENHTVNVSVEHFSFFSIFESAAEVVYDAVESVIGDEITSEYFGDLPNPIRYEFYDLEIRPQDVTAVVHAKLSLTTKAASGMISFGNLVSKTAGLAIGAIEDGTAELAKAMGALIFAEVGDYATDSTAGSFIVSAYDSFDLGWEIGEYIVDIKNADPSTAAVKASAWILAREMEYINENMDPAFKDLYKFNSLSGSRLDVYAVYFDAVPWKEELGLGASGVKFYYYDESSGEWINYYNDVFVWKMVFEADEAQVVAQDQAATNTTRPQATATQRPSSTPYPSDTPRPTATKPPASTATTAPTVTISRPTTGDIFVFSDGSGDYPTLDEALMAVESGARIILEAGIYYAEEYWGLQLDKSITILGIREDLTEIHFTNDNYFSVENNATLTLEAVSLHNTNFSVYVEDGEIIINDSRIYAGKNNAIMLRGNSTGIIQGSEITHAPGAWGPCILLWENSFIEIENSYISGCEYGIGFDDNASGIIRDNTIQDSIYSGIRLESYAQATIENNEIIENGYDGIYLSNHASATIRGNECSRNGSDGIYIGDYSFATVEGNTCNDNSSDGIQITGEADGSIIGNECAWNVEYGIDMMGSEALYLGSNNCHGNGVQDIYNYWDN